MGFRPYTGFDGVASGRRAGTQRFIELVNELSDGGLWNNGSYTVRLIRGKTSQSVHGTGRAVDLSWRRGGGYTGFGDYAKAKEWIDFLTANAAQLEIEMILDYYPRPYWTGYKCDRDATKAYTSHSITGAPGGDWIHVEVSPKVADDAAFFERTLPALRGQKVSVAEPEPDDIIEQPGPEDYPGKPVGVGAKRKKAVIAIQQRVGVVDDGIFGPKTLEAVQKFQRDNGLKVTDKVNKKTWVTMFGVPEGDDTTKVKPGEGWIQLATRALDDRSRWREIAGLNGGEGRVLLAGDVIILPGGDAPAEAKTAKVRAGDGWFSIAKRALGDRSRWTELATLNGGEDRVLHQGDELILPG